MSSLTSAPVVEVLGPGRVRCPVLTDRGARLGLADDYPGRLG